MQTVNIYGEFFNLIYYVLRITYYVIFHVTIDVISTILHHMYNLLILFPRFCYIFVANRSSFAQLEIPRKKGYNWNTIVSPVLLNNEGILCDIVLRHVIFGGFSGSDAGRSKLRSVRERGRRRRQPRASNRWWKGEGWRRVKGEGKRGGLKGSLAEILGKSSVKSHQNIPLPKPPLTRTILAWYQWYPPKKISIAIFSSVF